MNQQLDTLLCERYPAIFRDRQASMTVSAMGWGFECGDGWFALIDTLCQEIQRHVDATGLQTVAATQVKEKFGCLRFYLDGGDDYIFALTWFADYVSGLICEECGAPAIRTGTSWVQTRCAAHGGKDHPLDARESMSEPADEEDIPDGLSPSKQESWARAAAFHLPPVQTRGWRHVAIALEHSIKNDLRHNGLPPVAITVNTESDELHYQWEGGDAKGRLAGMLRLAAAYSARCDRKTGIGT